MSRPCRAALALASLVAAGAALAQRPSDFSNLQVLPNPARAGQWVAFVLHWGGCTPGYDTPSVNVEGNVVTVQASYSIFCGTPPPPIDLAVPLGRFAEGRYTLRFVGVPLDGGIPVADPPVDIPFTVTAGSGTPSPVPAGGWLSLAALGAWLARLAGRRLRA